MWLMCHIQRLGFGAKIFAVVPLDLILESLESQWRDLSKNVYFYSHLVYGSQVMAKSTKMCCDTQILTVSLNKMMPTAQSSQPPQNK